MNNPVPVQRRNGGFSLLGSVFLALVLLGVVVLFLGLNSPSQKERETLRKLQAVDPDLAVIYEISLSDDDPAKVLAELSAARERTANARLTDANALRVAREVEILVQEVESLRLRNLETKGTFLAVWWDSWLGRLVNDLVRVLGIFFFCSATFLFFLVLAVVVAVLFYATRPARS